jgi:replicative DNA helicase
MLERAFRSIIDIPLNGRMTIDKEELLENFRSFQKSHVRCEEEAYKKLYYRILDHFKRYVELPCFDLLKEHFSNEPGCEDVLVTLEGIEAEKPYIGGNYKSILKEIKSKQDLESLQEALNEANEIAIKGRKVGKTQMKGVEQAIDYFSIKSKEIRAKNMDFKTELQALDSREIQEAKDRYDHRKNNQIESLGIYTGLEQIDKSLNGLKHTELMIVAAYTAQGKTTFSINMLYQAVLCGWNSALFTLEMTVEEMQDMLYVLHTTNYEVWGDPAKPHYQKYLQYVGQVEYNDVREGRLTPELEEFYKAAMDDLDSEEEYGRLYIVQPSEKTFTVDDINIKCLEINSDLKTKDKVLEFCVIDYLRLLGVPGKSQGEREDLNQKIIGIKRLFLTFNNGQGLRGVSPHQIKREGYVRAMANGGFYMLSDLSDSSEIEKSGDVVITLFMDDAMRKSGLFKICNLKARRNDLFDPFEACANLAAKRIYTRADIKKSDLILDSKTTLELGG